MTMQTISSNTETKAAKDHRCDFCAGRIPKGDTYIKSTHAYDGSAYDWKTHKHCEALAKRLNMYDSSDDEGLTAESFQETVHEEYMEILWHIPPRQIAEQLTVLYDQLRSVHFKEKLGFVIRHYAQVDRDKEKEQAEQAR
jgi:hypothetical protein